MKLYKKQIVPETVKDFIVGEIYVGKDGFTYEVVDVNEDFIQCRLNKVIKRFRKVLYCGTMAAMNISGPVFLSSKIVVGDEHEFETRSYKKRGSNDSIQEN